MSHLRGPLAASAVALVASVALGVVLGLRSDPGPAASAVPTEVTPVAGAASHDALTGSAPRRGTNRSGTSSPADPSTAPTADPTEVDAGVERMPETPGATPSRLPGLGRTPSTGSPASLAVEAASARGRIADGYPVGLLPPLPQGTVLSSSVSPSGGHVQAALVVQVPRGSDAAVLRFYRTRLAPAGFVERPVRAVGGAQAASFARDGSGVVVTVRGATYSIFATLRIAQD